MSVLPFSARSVLETAGSHSEPDLLYGYEKVLLQDCSKGYSFTCCTCKSTILKRIKAMEDLETIEKSYRDESKIIEAGEALPAYERACKPNALRTVDRWLITLDSGPGPSLQRDFWRGECTGFYVVLKKASRMQH